MPLNEYFMHELVLGVESDCVEVIMLRQDNNKFLLPGDISAWKSYPDVKTTRQAGMVAINKKDRRQFSLLDNKNVDAADELRALHTPEIVIALCGPIGSPFMR